MASSAGEMTIDDAWEYIKSAALAGWSRTTRRMRAAGVVLIFLYVLSTFSIPFFEAGESSNSVPILPFHPSSLSTCIQETNKKI
jgi:hypothetical protein